MSEAPGAGPAPLAFSAVVGQDDAKLALLLAAVDPLLGGVLLRGDKGSAKTTLARGLAALLGPGAPFVELPLGATEDRVVGSIDIGALLGERTHAFRPGLLAAADGGVLYVDEINLLADHVVDTLLDVATSGVNRVERDGISEVHPARFVLVGSMNPEEGELRPQLLDRFGLTVEVHATTDPLERAEIVRRRLRFDGGGPDTVAADADARLRATLTATVPAPLCPDTVDAAVRLALAVGAEGLRADLSLCRAAAALAGWEGRAEAVPEDLRRVAALVLAHRRRRNPFDAPGLDDTDLDRALDDAIGPSADAPAADGADADADDAAAADAGANGDAGGGDGGPGGGDGAGGHGPHRSGAPGGGGSGARAATGAGPDGTGAGPDGTGAGSDGVGADPTGPEPGPDGPGGRDGDGRPAGGDRTAPDGRGDRAGADLEVGAGLRAPDARRGASADRAGPPTRAVARQGQRGASDTGRSVGTTALRHPGQRLAVAATALAAAGRTGGTDGATATATAGPAGGAVAGIAAADLRAVVAEAARATLVILAVDASGSMAARDRLDAARRAVLGLLGDAYRRRDRVALIVFRGTGAEVVLRPTGSVEIARTRLADIPTGGTTPLAAGLRAVTDMVRAVRRAGGVDPVAVIITDGRATAGGDDPLAAAEAAAAELAATATPCLVLDAETGPTRLGLGRALAGTLGADHVELASLGRDGRSVDDAVRRHVAAAGRRG